MTIRIKKEIATCFECGSTNLEIIPGMEGSNCIDCLEKADRNERIWDSVFSIHSRAGLALMGILWAAYLWGVYL